MSKKKVMVFEDIKGKRTELMTAFEKAFDSKADIEPFEPQDVRGMSSDPLTYEDKLIEYFKKKSINIEDIALIVTDRDLSQYMDEWGGLSEAAVSKVADIYAIPVCLYAREDMRFGPSRVRIKKKEKWSDYRIILDIEKGPAAIAKECLHFFDGFQTIRKKFEEVLSKKPKSPAEIMAFILDKPELQDRIALYGAGDQHVVQDILPYSHDAKLVKKRMPRMLGYWLWDSILRYPGIFVYGKAAASYLNIDPHDFVKKPIKDLFSKALYRGPFSGIQEYWWRNELDNLIFGADCTDGYSFARKRGKRVNECKCFVDTKLKAGYYCMINDEPVSDQNSQANISWFPSGADLARIAKKDFDKQAPWIGLY